VRTVISTDRTAAVELLRRGEIVALPTETVYGLAADALNPMAVAKIFEAKERPRFDPLIVHLPSRDWLEKIVDPMPPNRQLILRLADKFWPGPLTMVLPKRGIIPEIVTAGLDMVAVRISAHPIFAEIIHLFGKPLAAPSANRFGRVSPTAAEHVLDELDGRISLVIDAGPTHHGLESTIVSVRANGIEILRRGPITAERLSEFAEVNTVASPARRISLVIDAGPTHHGLESTIVSVRANGIEILRRGPITAERLSEFAEVNTVASPARRISAPGQFPSHYAPKTQLRLIDCAESFFAEKDQRVGLLAWNPRSRKGDLQIGQRRTGNRRSLKFSAVRHLSERQDLREAATNLFRYLRELDALGLDLIVAERVPGQGLGAAILDRLERASRG